MKVGDEQQILATFQKERLYPLQKRVIEDVINGKNVVVTMPVGSGKSLCYQAPAALNGGSVIVLSPLVALMNDQVQQMQALGLHAITVHSVQTPAEKAANLEALSNSNVQMIYLSPEQFSRPHILEPLAQRDVRLVAIDEAHCVSEWGHDFRPAFFRISYGITAIGKPPIGTFTATATPQVIDDIVDHLKLEAFERHQGPVLRGNLRFTCEQHTHTSKIDRIAEFLEDESRLPAIVYCSSRRDVRRVFVRTRRKHKGTVFYHGGLSKDERDKYAEKFLSGEAPIMVATNAFGMGVHKPDIRSVVHFNLPGSIEQYYQESGRAGRDGAESDCLLLTSPKDVVTQKYLIEFGGHQVQHLRRFYDFVLGSPGLTPFVAGTRYARGLPFEKANDVAFGTMRFLRDSGCIQTKDGGLVVLEDREQLESLIALAEGNKERALARLEMMQTYASAEGGHASIIDHYFRYGTLQVA